MTAIPRADGVVLGPVSHYSYPAGQSNPSAALRTGFNLYANVRPCRSRPGLSLLRDPMDLVIVRENTDGFYADRSMHMGPGELMPDPDSAFALRQFTATALRRVTRPACAIAMPPRQRLTDVPLAPVPTFTAALSHTKNQ